IAGRERSCWSLRTATTMLPTRSGRMNFLIAIRYRSVPLPIFQDRSWHSGHTRTPARQRSCVICKRDNMRRIAFRLLVISSALLLVTTAQARTRPRYGDSVRAEVRASAPSYEGAPDLLAGLVFETLVTTDDNGHLAPGLALTWTSPNGGYTWQFALR